MYDITWQGILVIMSLPIGFMVERIINKKQKLEKVE